MTSGTAITEEEVRRIVMLMVGEILEVNDECPDKEYAFKMRGVVLFQGNRAIRRLAQCLPSQ